EAGAARRHARATGRPPEGTPAGRDARPKGRPPEGTPARRDARPKGRPPEGTPARRDARPREGTARPAGRDGPRRWGKARPILGIPACRLRLWGRGCFTVAGGRDCVVDDSDLQRMTPEERARSARVLAGLNAQSLAPTPPSHRRRPLLLPACMAALL